MSWRTFFTRRCPTHGIKYAHLHTPFGPWGCILCERELRAAASRRVLANFAKRKNP